MGDTNEWGDRYYRMNNGCTFLFPFVSLFLFFTIIVSRRALDVSGIKWSALPVKFIKSGYPLEL